MVLRSTVLYSILYGKTQIKRCTVWRHIICLLWYGYDWLVKTVQNLKPNFFMAQIFENTCTRLFRHRCNVNSQFTRTPLCLAMLVGAVYLLEADAAGGWGSAGSPFCILVLLFL
jgi:hypothetical protein